MKNFAVVTFIMLLCSIVFGACTNSEDGEPSFVASVKNVRIMVPIEVRDTIWQKEYVTVRDTIIVENEVIVRDTTIIRDVDSVYVEVIKKEGIKANGTPGLEKIDDKRYLTWYPLIEDGNQIEPSTELNISAEIENCNHDIIVVSSPIIGAPRFSAEKTTRQYQSGKFTKMEFKAAWTYNFDGFSETINTVHEKAWYYGWQMLSSYWTGGLKEVRYGAEQSYVYNGTEGTLYENTLVWEFTYNEKDVRTFTKTHRFFVPSDKQDDPDPIVPPTPEKSLTSVEEKSFDGDKTYVITRHYSDGSVSDTTVINNYGYTHKIVMPTLSRLYRDNTDFGKPTISKNGSASKVGSSSTKGGLTFQTMSQEMNAAYNDHSHVIELQYTALTYTEKGKSCNLSVPTWTLSYNAVNKGTVRTETQNSHNYEVTPVSFVYNGAFGSNSAKYNTDTEVWKDKGEEASQTGTLGKNFGFDYVNPTTSYTYATFYAIMSDGTEKKLGTDGVQIFNSVEAPASQSIDTDNFNVSDANAVEGSKQLVGTREVAGKYGKFIVKKYKTTYTTKTNKAQVVFVAYHEEAEFVPTIGDSFAMTSKTYSFTDLGSSNLVDLGRKDGKNGMMYKSQISASFNGRSSDASAEVNLWVASANQYGIASASQSHTWDYNNAHHVASIFVYNIYDGNGNVVDGGLKGFIDGKEVLKASWDEVNAPSGIVGLAQQANGSWIFCNVSGGYNSYTWRSIMKSSNNKAITSIDVRQLLIQGYKEVAISSSTVENSDGSVTVSSASGSATAAAW